MFEGQPKGLFALALANTGERFGYYTMLAVFALFLRANYGLDAGWAGEIYSDFLMLVYFLPIVGGWLADRFGFGRMVTIGILIMFAGYLLLSIPLGGDTFALVVMLAALVLIGFGTGLFKGNLQVMVGDLYNDPQYANKRDAGFSLFYMAINIGALFAPTAAVRIMEWSQQNLGTSVNDSYHFAFAIACASLILSIAIYYIFRGTFRHVEGGKGKADKTQAASTEPELTKEETTQRVVALCLVFAVVIFFWMAFHQNGLSLTYFADEFTAKSTTGTDTMPFDVINLVMIIFIVYAGFSLFQSKTSKGKGISAAIILVALGILGYKYTQATGEIAISAPIFQQFNPCFVVILTPVSVALFGWLGSKGKEPKAPVKIGLGMLVAAFAYLMLAVNSIGLPAADPVNHPHLADVGPSLLVQTYLILTFAELLLSPIGISFVTKVSPAKYKGMMMGGWFVATAIGNKLVSIPGHMWGMDLTIVWGTLMAICLLAALFIFSIIKKLNKVA